ncbi:MAG: LysR family transcriptional regulator [Symploca sp. SIO2B6]|nr:LysR family transcriptional regulator [Symploca sp. SIO2B6]
MDKLEGMRAFVEVVNQGGFAAAGRHMGRSRSVINKLVLQLETELGVSLLQRTTRCVSPTDAGRALYERCLNILADVDAAEQAVAQLQVEPKGTLRINAPMSFGTLHLAPAIAAFTTQYPELNVQLTLSDRFVDLLEEGFDITLRIATLDPNDPLITHELAPIKRVFCAAPTYLEKHGIPHQPSDLHDHDCLQYGYLATGNQWRLIGPDGTQQSVTVRCRYYSNNGEVLREAAIKGIGIALLPTFMLQDALQQGSLQTVMSDYAPPPLTAFLAYPPNRHLSTKIQHLTAFLQEWFSQLIWVD